MARHSFIRMTKLPNVKGRIDYISNPKRQEHLYASYSTVEPVFWQYLSAQAQQDFWRSHQKKGKCIEARELIIALPESLQRHDPDILLQLFVETFRKQYGMQCAAALHHNKAKTNYHIHLVFADREVLEKTEVKTASRNMFFNETGRRVRTKKEILDGNGNVRPGCRILSKGETYDIKWFSARKDVFKSRGFMQEAKRLFTGLINQCVSREEEKLQIFDPSGPYLPTKKIGKNNPLAEVIASDNELRQEWNRTVDQVLIAGGTHEEVTEFKTAEVTAKVAASFYKNGNDPGLFSQLLRFAIDVLKEFLDILMKADPPKATPPVTEPADAEYRKAKADFLQMDVVHQRLNKCNRKLYALQKRKKAAIDTLNSMPRDLFHRKDRKEKEEQIEGLQRQIDLTRSQLESIPRQFGFKDVRGAEAAYKSMKAKMETLKMRLGIVDDSIETVFKPQSQKQKVSVLKELATRRLEMQHSDYYNKHTCKDRLV